MVDLGRHLGRVIGGWLIGLVKRWVRLWVEWNLQLNILGRRGIEDDKMDLFKMLKKGMEVVEMETAAGIITALSRYRQDVRKKTDLAKNRDSSQVHPHDQRH